MIVPGDCVRWRGLSGHEGVVVDVSRRHAWVAYLDNPGEPKDALLSDLVLADGPISDSEQEFIDGVTAKWFR